MIELPSRIGPPFRLPRGRRAKPMNVVDKYLLETSSYTALDVMLADVAVRVQLTPTDYTLAEDRYKAINEWIEREGSPLHGRVELFCPQGGFMIGATVARHSTDSEFDIDVMAQITWPLNIDPELALATTHAAIKGERGSRYYDKCDRKTRCSTVQYVGMHLDVTTAVLCPGREERTSYIFHSKEADRRRLLANPFGFAKWFIGLTPVEENFGKFFESRSLDFNRVLLETLAKTDSEPVPKQAPVYRKSRAVIALQLIKRWRNLAYDRRHAAGATSPRGGDAIHGDLQSHWGRTHEESRRRGSNLEYRRITGQVDGLLEFVDEGCAIQR